jgi:hypothetical protein
MSALLPPQPFLRYHDLSNIPLDCLALYLNVQVVQLNTTLLSSFVYVSSPFARLDVSKVLRVKSLDELRPSQGSASSELIRPSP